MPARGRGLGLTLARAVVERQGGEVSLDETPGGGTTAHVTVPRSTKPVVDTKTDALA